MMTHDAAAGLPKTIVVIEDSLTIRKFIESALTPQPYVGRLLVAENGEGGLELIRAVRPDLIICDLTLPDRRGDEICRELLHSTATSRIPIILMSSESEEISALQKRFKNITHIIVKPFSRQLLIATVGYIIRSLEDAQSNATVLAARGPIAFRGSSATYPLTGALQAIATRKLTGILRVASENVVLSAYCKEGSILLVSTRSVELYLRGTPYETRGRKNALWQACEEKQRETLSPFLLNLSDLGGLAELTAATLSDLYGQMLFARLWKEVDVSFEFEQSELPAFTQRTQSHSHSMNEWIFQTLRYVEDADALTEMAGDPMGVPVLTPDGCRKICEFHPNRADSNILSLIDGAKRLHDICELLQITPAEAAHRLFCYRQLGLVDYWPSSLLQTGSD